MDLILIRHGLPLRDDTSADPPLSEVGHAQARAVGALLQGEGIYAVFASTMQRAIQTAEPFAAGAALDLATHEGVCEYDRGSGLYIPSEELKREDYTAWQAAVDHDLSAFGEVVVETLEGIVQSHPGARVAVFCHGGVINAWTAHVLKMPARLFFNPTYASVSRFSCARTGQRSIITLNESHHLRELAV